ncbi:hypothetical protein ACWGS9_14565 [Bradyrhizobium sp. Arg314]
MNSKTMSICLVFSLSNLGGVAFGGALDVIDNINERSFYTNSIARPTATNPIMRNRFKLALATLPRTKRKALMRDCQDAGMTKPYAEFCADLNALAGS